MRVSGSPSGSKRTTNNLSARRPPPPSASSRSPTRPPPSSREAALRLAAGLASALSPGHPGLWRLCCVPCPLPYCFSCCWGCLNQLSPRSSHHCPAPDSHPLFLQPPRDDLQGRTSYAPLVAEGGVSGVLETAGGLRSIPHPPSFDRAAEEPTLQLATTPSLFPNLCYFTPQRQTLNCTFIVYKHLRQLF